MKSKELKTKLSHAHSLILSHCISLMWLSLTVSASHSLPLTVLVCHGAGAAVDHIWLGTTDESRMVGVADRGLIASFPPLACGAPVLIAATAGTLSIRWAAPPTTCAVHVDTCVYEAVSGYTIQYWLEDDISTLKTIEVGVGLSYKLTRLAYFRTYAMRVRATNIIGTGLW